MKNIIKAISVVLLITSYNVNSTVLFDNGATIDPSNTTWNDTYSASYTIYDDFQISSNSTITDINYGIFIQSAANYVQTYVTILDSFGGLIITPTFTVTGTLTSNGLASGNANVPFGFDVVLDGLSINLAAGSYVLGLSTEMTSGFSASIASGDSGFGSALRQNDSQRAEHMVFSLESTGTVPEPATLALLGLGLAGLGFSKKRKA